MLSLTCKPPRLSPAILRNSGNARDPNSQRDCYDLRRRFLRPINDYHILAKNTALYSSS